MYGEKNSSVACSRLIQNAKANGVCVKIEGTHKIKKIMKLSELN